VKALTLHQPYASLIAVGDKRVETRYWRTGYRGRLAIHAAKRPPYLGGITLERLGAIFDSLNTMLLRTLPRGVVIATAELVACVPVEKVDFDPDWHGNPAGLLHDPSDAEAIIASPLESYFGNYTPGRFAWLLRDVQPIEPVPARGQQGLWNWEAS
jgi:hypothetical protein